MQLKKTVILSLKSRGSTQLLLLFNLHAMALAAGDLLKLHGDVRELNLRFYHNVQDKYRTAVLGLLLRSVPHHHEEMRQLFFEEFQTVRTLVEERSAGYALLSQTEVEEAGRLGVEAYRTMQVAMKARKIRNMEECMHVYNTSFIKLKRKLAAVLENTDLLDRITLFVKERFHVQMQPTVLLG
jgi:hypothetical protein